MFTGIVEATGRVQSVETDEGGRRLEIVAPELATSLGSGQSISVDGACLTVETTEDAAFTVFLASETIERTTLATREAGDAVNLERAMPAEGRFDGHLVQGHVDTTTPVTAIDRVGEDWMYTFELPLGYEQYIVEKGSITLDGVSLTVAERTAETFAVAIVPTTYDRTTISDRAPGNRVHVEVDVIAKYVESILPRA